MGRLIDPTEVVQALDARGQILADLPDIVVEHVVQAADDLELGFDGPKNRGAPIGRQRAAFGRGAD